jgi:hypothetical protein
MHRKERCTWCIYTISVIDLWSNNWSLLLSNLSKWPSHLHRSTSPWCLVSFPNSPPASLTHIRLPNARRRLAGPPLPSSCCRRRAVSSWSPTDSVSQYAASLSRSRLHRRRRWPVPSLGYDTPTLAHLASPLSMTHGIQVGHLQDVMVQAGRLQAVMVQAGRLQAGGLQELIS